VVKDLERADRKMAVAGGEVVVEEAVEVDVVAMLIEARRTLMVARETKATSSVSNAISEVTMLTDARARRMKRHTMQKLRWSLLYCMQNWRVQVPDIVKFRKFRRRSV
jgi:hypothetical protein